MVQALTSFSGAPAKVEGQEAEKVWNHVHQLQHVSREGCRTMQSAHHPVKGLCVPLVLLDLLRSVFVEIIPRIGGLIWGTRLWNNMQMTRRTSII